MGQNCSVICKRAISRRIGESRCGGHGLRNRSLRSACAFAIKEACGNRSLAKHDGRSEETWRLRRARSYGGHNVSRSALRTFRHRRVHRHGHLLRLDRHTFRRNLRSAAAFGSLFRDHRTPRRGCPEPSFRLHKGGRYAHKKSYVARVRKMSLSIVATSTSVLRMEYGSPVEALVFAAKRSV